MPILRELTKKLALKIGSRLSVAQFYMLETTMNYVETGRWLRAHGYLPCPRVDQREQLFDLIGAQVGDKDVLYLEFGVHRGDSIAYWTRVLKNPSSHLHGFDSFEGLPETWKLGQERGRFSTNGAIPKIDDPRVSFFKGWFQDTLPNYVAPPHEQLVVSLDADLYSSTSYVLQQLKPIITVGTYLYFDEFADRFHELKAFDEFLAAEAMSFRLVAATKTYTHVVFQRVS